MFVSARVMGVVRVVRVRAGFLTGAMTVARVPRNHGRVVFIVVGEAMAAVASMAGARLSYVVRWWLLDVAIISGCGRILFDAVEGVAFAAIGVGVRDMLVALYSVLSVDCLVRPRKERRVLANPSSSRSILSHR